jgi:crotonobetainyl-CoA:carnitine CoA-transferase CaiB-like acyl-CoA transferase
MDINQPFSGLRVIELASVLAGPAVGMFFAELGAEVIKIENPRTGGDITRKWKLPAEDAGSGTSGYYISTNWGKSTRLTDITTGNGQAAVHALLADSDILIVNFKPGDAEKYGLDYKSLQPRFPKLIYAQLSGYGENDPRPAFDLALQAETGFMSMNGTAESGPLKMPVAMIDLAAAHQLKEGILTALYLREKTQRGNRVSVSLYDAAVASLANQAGNFLVAGHVPQRTGSLHPNIAPYGETFRCSDSRFLVLAVGTDAQFARLCETAGLNGTANDPRFSANTDRVRNREELYGMLQPFFSAHTSHEAEARLAKANVPCAVIRDLRETLEAKASQRLILDSPDGKCVRTAVFSLQESPGPGTSNRT